MATHQLNLKVIDPSWQDCFKTAFKQLDPHYLTQLTQSDQWLPGPQKIFNAFSLPLNQVNYVLFGESPYPRAESANGFAFWDAAVNHLWSETGLDKQVNRATSLRNIIKMLLIAEGKLAPHHTSQPDIAALSKTGLVQTNRQFFENFLHHGFLLLNTTLVLQPNSPPRKDAHAWSPFMQQLLVSLVKKRPEVKFILLGHIAGTVEHFLAEMPVDKIHAEHPYNLSFISNPKVLNFFKPLHLLSKVSP
jgi:uracil-DNA glycosylase